MALAQVGTTSVAAAVGDTTAMDGGPTGRSLPSVALSPSKPDPSLSVHNTGTPHGHGIIWYSNAYLAVKNNIHERRLKYTEVEPLLHHQ